MAVNVTKWAAIGALVGVGTGYLINGANTVFGWLASVLPINISVQSAAPVVDLKITGIRALVDPGASGLVKQMFGVLPIDVPAIFMLAIAGALFFVISAYALDMLGMTPSSKGGRLAAVLALSSLLTTLVVSYTSGAIAIPAIVTIVAVGIAALIYGYALAWADKEFNLNAIP